MFQTIQKSRHIVLICVGIAVSILVTTIITPFSNGIIDNLYSQQFTAKQRYVKEALEAEKQVLVEETEDLTSQRVFNRYIEDENILQLISLLNNETERRGIDGMLVTNRDGMVLSRTRAIERRGDYIHMLSGWGRALARGESVASIERGIAWPMLIVAAQNVREEGGRIGDLVSVFIPNNSYAVEFKERYLSDNHIAFYTKEKGVIGHSFNDAHIGDLLATYFSSGSGFIQNGNSGQYIHLNDSRYYVENIPFTGIEGDEFGGALVFFSYEQTYYNSLVTFLVLVVLVSLLLVMFRRIETPRIEQMIFILCIGSVVGTTVFFANERLLDTRTVFLSEPAHVIYNATMRFDPEYAVMESGFDLKVGIQIFVGGETVNAVQTVIHFDPEHVRVEDILTTASFCHKDFFIERSIDNEIGEVRIACGVPDPGFDKLSGTIAELVISPLRGGDFELRFGEETQVLAHDGLGTNVLRVATDGTYHVSSREQSNEMRPLLVFSPTHPNASRWYNTRHAQFTWEEFSEESREYWYAFDRNPDTIPNGEDRTNANDIGFSINDDGIYYFHLAVVRDGMIEGIAHRKILADITPPEQPVVRLSNDIIEPGDIVRIEFYGEDAMSGLQQTFYIRFGDGMLLPIGPQLFTTFMQRGGHTFTLRTFDRAGNYSESSATVTVTR